MKNLKINRIALTWVCVVLLGVFTLDSVIAQGQVSVINISPAATEVTSEIPPVPARISIFGWQGVPNTDYTVQISIDAEPALVVGIGAKVRSSDFDADQKILTVSVSYSGARILDDDQTNVPDKSFLLAVDPGIDNTSPILSASRETPAIISLPAKNSRPCYGPGADVTRAHDSSGDFGDDGGLLDPPVANTSDLTVGFPKAAAGTFASTNSFFWCAIPPTSGGLNPGFMVLGPKGATDNVEIFLSSSFLNFLGAPSNVDLSALNLALFSQDVQVSVDVNDVDDGAFAAATLLFQEGVTSVGHDPKSTILSSSADLQEVPPAKFVNAKSRATEIRGDSTRTPPLIPRSFEFGSREKLSLAPSSTSPKGSAFGLFGFVGDPSLVGATIEIIRVQQLKCNDVSAFATSGVTIARDKISPSGSFNIKIPTSSAFPTNSSRAMLVSRITGDQVQQSRQISLSNQARNSRR